MPIDRDKFFSRCLAISLRRREDRRDAFKERLDEVFENADWSYGGFRWFFGYDGARLPKPVGHFPPPGAFGCAFSHVSAWAKALTEIDLNDEKRLDDPCLFFEDDAYFCDRFPEKLEVVLKYVPDDWEIFYLGGEILNGRPLPAEVALGVARAQNVNRLHAYAVKARALPKLFHRILAYLPNAPQRSGPSGEESCFDYEVGRMCEEGELVAYCSKPWLVGQAGLGSDTYPTSDASNVRFWNY